MKRFNGTSKMFILASHVVIATLLAGCVQLAEKNQTVIQSLSSLSSAKIQLKKEQPKTNVHPKIADAMTHAPSPSKKVLHAVGNMMAKKEIIVGACWDYLNEAFTRAGYPQSQRTHVFKGKYKGGRYADTNLIKPGDWLYYVNHSYHDIQHSGLFISWVNKAQKKALIFSYAGEGRKDPARLRVYRIDQVYNIMRAKD